MENIFKGCCGQLSPFYHCTFAPASTGLIWSINLFDSSYRAAFLRLSYHNGGGSPVQSNDTGSIPSLVVHGCFFLVDAETTLELVDRAVLEDISNLVIYLCFILTDTDVTLELD